MAKAHMRISKRKVTFKKDNQVANCPVCGKFYNKKNNKDKS